MYYCLHCDKEVFPDQEDLTGTWIEQTDSTNKHELLIDKDTLTLFFSIGIPIQYTYFSSENDEIIRLNPIGITGSEDHQITFTKKSMKLAIWNIFKDMDGRGTGKIVFEKK